MKKHYYLMCLVFFFLGNLWADLSPENLKNLNKDPNSLLNKYPVLNTVSLNQAQMCSLATDNPNCVKIDPKKGIAYWDCVSNEKEVLEAQINKNCKIPLVPDYDLLQKCLDLGKTPNCEEQKKVFAINERFDLIPEENKLLNNDPHQPYTDELLRRCLKYQIHLYCDLLSVGFGEQLIWKKNGGKADLLLIQEVSNRLCKNENDLAYFCALAAETFYQLKRPLDAEAVIEYGCKKKADNGFVCALASANFNAENVKKKTDECKAMKPDACLSLATMANVLERKGLNVEVESILSIACDHGAVFACDLLGKRYMVLELKKKAYETYQKGCHPINSKETLASACEEAKKLAEQLGLLTEKK